MIAKTSSPHNSFRQAINYVADENKLDWKEIRNCTSNSTELVIQEMRATADLSARTQKPVYHVSLSWHEQDNPTKEQMIEVADEFLNHMGLDEHQAIVVAHSDRSHPHMHIVVNRVHPERHKAWELYKWEGKGKDRKMVQNHHGRVEDFLRTTEKQFGWKITPGRHSGEWQKEFDGMAPKIWEIKLHEKSKKVAAGLAVENVDLRPIKERASELKDELYKAESFAEFDQVLAKNGLWIKAKGQGAVITDGSGYDVKSSSISRGFSGPKLEQRFGESLKAYCQDREKGVDVGKASVIMEEWSDTYRKYLNEQINKTANSAAKTLQGKLNKFTKYDSEYRAWVQEYQQSFKGAFVNGREAYDLIDKYIHKTSVPKAASEITANPGKFGEVKDHGAVKDISDCLHNLEKMKGRYSTSITSKSYADRSDRMRVLKKNVSKWKSLRTHFSRPVRSQMRGSEGGQAFESSTAELISISRAANRMMENPQKAPIHGGINALQKITSAMDSEGGRVAGSMLVKAHQHIQTAAQILSNPGSGSIKILKNIVQSSVRILGEQGRERGRGR